MSAKVLSPVVFARSQKHDRSSFEYWHLRFRAVAALAIWALFAGLSGLVHAQSITSFGFQVAVPLVPGTVTTGPTGVAIDASGDIFVSDFSTNNRLIEIPAGCTTTSCQIVVATGLNKPTGVAVDSSGDLFIANYGANEIVEVPSGCGSSSCWNTISGTLSKPSGVAVDTAGDLFIADFGNSRVVEIPSGCATTSCWATVGSGLNDPFGVALDKSSNLYVADFYGDKIVKIPSGCSTLSCQTVVASGASLNHPTAVVSDTSGDIYFTNYSNNEVLEVPSGCAGSSCWVPVGNGLNSPFGVAVNPSGDLYIGDYANNRLLEAKPNSFNLGTVNVGNTSSTVTVYFNFGSSVTLNATPYQVLTQGQTGLDFADAGGEGASGCAATTYGAASSCIVNVNLTPLYAGLVTGAVALVDNSNNRIATAYIGGTGSGPQITFFTNPVSTTTLGASLSSPAGLTVDRKGNIFVADSDHNAVDEFVAASSYSESILNTSFSNPSDVAVDGAGNLFVADTGHSAVEELPAPSYSPATSLGSGWSSPSAVTVDGAGNVFVADSGDHTVSEIAAPGYTAVTTLNSSFTSPTAIAADASGNLFVTDSSSGAVSELTVSGGYATANQLITGLAQPASLALDASGNLYVSENGNGVVDEFLAANSYSRSTLSTSFTAPTGVALDAVGNVYVTASGSTQVSELNLGTAPTLDFGTQSTGTKSSPMTVTVSNIGNASLTFPVAAAFDATTQANGSFTLDASTTCSSNPLSLGTNCAEAIDFSPSNAQSYTGTFMLTDNDENTPSPYATQDINLKGKGETITFVTAALSNGAVGVALTPQTLQVSGGTGPYTFAVTGGAFPAGLSLSSAGTLSGTPTAGGTFSGIQVTATDTATNATASYTYSITINPATIALASASLPDGTYNSSYSQALPAASGGTSPYAYSLSSGSLPPGLSVSGAGVISGTSTAAGTYSNFVILVTDSSTGTGPYSTTQTYSITIAKASPTLAWAPAGTIAYGTSLSSELNASAAYQGQSVIGTFSYTAQSGGSSPIAVTSATLLQPGTYTLTASFSPSDATDYSAVSTTAPLTVTVAALTVIANNAAKVYGTANPTFTGSVTGAVNGDTFTESFTTSATTGSNAGTYAIVPSATGADLADYTVNAQNGTLTITQAGSTTSLGVSSQSITPGQSVALTATVVSVTTGTPTGTVSFYDGATLLDTATLSAGAATYTTSSLSAGATHQLTATYSGDSNFTASSSTQSVSVVVAGLDFSLATIAPSSQTVMPGQSVSYQIAVNPLYGSYPGPVSFTLTGQPAGSTVTFFPATIAASGGQQIVTMTIQAAPATAALHPAPASGRARLPLALALLLLPLVGARRLRRHGRALGRMSCVLLLLLCSVAAVILNGCGGAFFSQTPETYTLSVTATSGNVQHTTTASLNVQ